jgi:hypothetical protein
MTAYKPNVYLNKETLLNGRLYVWLGIFQGWIRA